MTSVQARAARSAVVLIGGGVLVAAILVPAGLLLAAHRPSWDDQATALAAGRGGRWLEVGTLVLSHAGHVPGVVVTLVIALAVARRRGRWREVSLVGVAATVELGVFLVVSTVVDRPRPAVPSPDAPALTGAFPSGHAAMAVVLFAGLATLLAPAAGEAPRRAGWAGAGAAAVLAAAARVVRGQHRPSEAVAGLVLGAAVLALVVRVSRRDGWFPDDPEPTRGEPAAPGPAAPVASDGCLAQCGDVAEGCEAGGGEDHGVGGDRGGATDEVAPPLRSCGGEHRGSPAPGYERDGERDADDEREAGAVREPGRAAGSRGVEDAVGADGCRRDEGPVQRARGGPAPSQDSQSRDDDEDARPG